MRHRKSRKAAACIEFAICLPLVILIFLGTFDAISMVFFQQSLELAAVEGSRVAEKQNSKTADVVRFCEAFLAKHGITDVDVTTTPSEVAGAEPGRIVQITVSAPCDSAGISFLANFYQGRTAETTISVMRRNTQ